MDCKLIAIDADGTLLGENYIIPEDNKRAVRQAAEKGVKVVLCSGRSYASLQYFAQDLGLNTPGNYAVSFNGATVHALGGEPRLIRDIRMSKELMLAALSFGEGFGVEPIVYREVDEICLLHKTEYTDFYAATSKSRVTFVNDFERDIAQSVYKVMFIGENEALLRIQEHAAASGRKDFNMFLSAPILLEFTPPEVTKGAGLLYLCGELGIDIKDTIAVGDSYNDISMLTAAGLGVAMKNANEDIKRAADYVTRRDNRECGVAEVIDKFILIY